MGNGNRLLALVVPLAVGGGWAAGALTAWYLVRREVEKLRAALEPAPAPAPAPPQQAAAVAAPAPVPAPAPVAAKEEEEIPEEVLMVLSAAVAAFLGKRARVRAVRVVRPGLSAWAQQGRVSIQASHRLARQ
jgi:methylmalonyl-CoA carboxyltransferase large subunit